MQVDPMTPMLKAPGTKLLKVKCDKLLSRFAFNFNLHRYSEELREHCIKEDLPACREGEAGTWGLHSSTFSAQPKHFL